VKIEFMPWYEAGESILRCGGDDGCGAMLVSGDTEVHMKHHKRIDSIEEHLVRIENRINFPEHHARILGDR
jgi:hypothetical protein